METGWLKTVIITALMLTIAFSGWTANQIVNVKENYISKEQYYNDLDKLVNSTCKLHDSIDHLREIVYQFHLAGDKK